MLEAPRRATPLNWDALDRSGCFMVGLHGTTSATSGQAIRGNAGLRTSTMRYIKNRAFRYGEALPCSTRRALRIERRQSDLTGPASVSQTIGDSLQLNVMPYITRPVLRPITLRNF
jgi:hypothetical protein